jgi:hypothetical protein
MPNRPPRNASRSLLIGGVAFSLLFLFLLFSGRLSSASSAAQVDQFRIGERLTYAVDFGKLNNVAYVELFTASKGRIGETEAVELRARVKTLDLLSAAFYLVDESRTIYAAPDSGLPLYIARTQYIGGLPRENIQNYLSAPTVNYDIVTLIYKIRQAQAAGSFNLYEDDKVYPVTFQVTATERIKTDAGEFDTNVYSVQSEYLVELGIRDLRIYLSTDEAKIPAGIRFRTKKGEFRARIASIQNIEPPAEPVPTPAPISTPRPTPAPTATPRPYVDNLPLSEDLSFVLGETLEYRLTMGGQPSGSFVLQALERRQVQGEDLLLLSATVTDAPNGSPFAKGDAIRALVNPDTLGPKKFEIAMSGSLANLSQTATFDARTNTIAYRGANRVDAPVGTHSVLSLLYAMRSFNLKPSKDTSNPVNDTRVAVFWENKPTVFFLRPSEAGLLTLQGGEKVSAQQVTVTTNVPALDALNIKVWLSNDARRVPLKFSLGRYHAELVSDRVIPPRAQ